MAKHLNVQDATKMMYEINNQEDDSVDLEGDDSCYIKDDSHSGEAEESDSNNNDGTVGEDRSAPGIRRVTGGSSNSCSSIKTGDHRSINQSQTTNGMKLVQMRKIENSFSVNVNNLRNVDAIGDVEPSHFPFT